MSDPLLSADRLTPIAVAEITGFHLHTIRRWMRTGVRGVILHSSYVGGRRFIRRTELAAFLRKIQKRRVAHA